MCLSFLLATAVFVGAAEPPPSPMNQIPPPARGAYQPRVAFDQGKVVTIKELYASKPVVTIQGPGEQTSAGGDFSGLSRRSLIYHRGQFWALSLPRDPQATPTLEFKSSPDGHSWKTEGFFNQASSRFKPEVALPLGNGRVLCIHMNAVGDREPTSFFGIYRRNEKGFFEFATEGSMGLNVPLMKLIHEPGLRSSWSYNSSLHVISRESPDFVKGIVSTDSYFTVIHAVSGICWVFDAEDGRLKRVAPLYSEVMDRLDNLSAIEMVFLAWQAEDSGRVLLASRSEDAVFGARKVTALALRALEWPKPPASASPEDLAVSRAQFEAFHPKFAQALKPGLTAFPVIHWWSFDPETGEYEPTVPPEGAPPFLKELSDLGLVLEPLPGGGKRVVPPKPVENPKPAESEQAPAAKGAEQPPQTTAR